jgi:hypothetical protein
LGWVGCDDGISRKTGVDDCGGIGVETSKIGVGEKDGAPMESEEALAPISPALDALEPADVSGDEWQIGDRVRIDTDVPSLREFNNRVGTVEVVKDVCAQCLVNFDGGEYMHIPFRGLRRIE